MHGLSREASRILQNSRTFFNTVHTQHLVAKPSIAGTIVEMFLNILPSSSQWLNIAKYN